MSTLRVQGWLPAGTASPRVRCPWSTGGGPALTEQERRRWMLRDEERTRQTFSRPHLDDFPGCGRGAAT